MYSRFFIRKYQISCGFCYRKKCFFFAYPENLLANMMFDDRDLSRKLAQLEKLKVALNTEYLNQQKLTSLLEITPKLLYATSVGL